MHRLAVLVALCSPLTAQKMPVAGDDGRIVQVFDLRATLELVGARPARSARSEAELAELPATHRAELVDAMRRFVEPALGDGDVIAELGPDRAVALVSQAQAAWLERFLDTVAKADHEQSLAAQFALWKLPVAAAAEVFGRDDLGESFAIAVDRDAMRRLRKATEAWHDGPTGTSWLHGWWGRFGSGMPFVSAWRSVPLRGRRERLVAPVIEKFHDGIEFTIRHVPLPGGAVGHVLVGEVEVVDWDTPPTTVTVGGEEHETDAPARQVARFDDVVVTTAAVPIVFARRAGDVFVVVTFEPRRR